MAAPGTAAPEPSRTMPESVPVAVCASAISGSATIADAKEMNAFRNIESSPADPTDRHQAAPAKGAARSSLSAASDYWAESADRLGLERITGDLRGRNDRSPASRRLHTRAATCARATGTTGAVRSKHHDRVPSSV